MGEAVIERIKRIEERVNALEQIIRSEYQSSTRSSSLATKELLALPSSLQKTLLAVQELGEGTASQIAEKTGRVRSVETIYLNQLTRLGSLTRIRRGRKIYFKVLKYY